ncbi:T9SS type A sorting domain-containing protein [Flavobacterium sp. Sd200]|uniref:T9SS type A sorting domain-containing protein n=1 Tax=Flavobacterium sp. Sd200 TaxID=2692211 RepID=UPI00136CB3A0|nr:T9SS type A sorting domain-containing protein [Flavobacterium sp. Sd200]MXN90343.1 T9SS type A sorting domain-containing protein [Flavobacterium sp. Sd200]
MKKYLIKFCLLLFISISGYAQYADPNFPIPATGYGSNGLYTVAVESLVNLNFIGHPIKVYHPAEVTTAVPTIFYSHAYGGTDPENIIGILEFIAKKGYAVVFVPYATANTVTIDERYQTLVNGFGRAATNYPDIIDTTRVGFLGHSFGGGASFGISHQFFEEGWGTNGRFIYALAQWYSYIDPADLTTFPEDVKVLFEIFNDDDTNDHRMAVDIFNRINTPAAEKDFLLVSSSTVNGYNYVADHVLPNTAAAYDALDYYAYYRLLDALCDYTFNGNLDGKNVALGHGSVEQVTMPQGMGNLQQLNQPTVSYPQDHYLWRCDDEMNPRAEFCDDVTASTPPFVLNIVKLYPNPVNSSLSIEKIDSKSLDIIISNSLGRRIYQYNFDNKTTTLDVSNLERGIYFISINGILQKFMKL